MPLMHMKGNLGYLSILLHYVHVWLFYYLCIFEELGLLSDDLEF